MESVGGIEWASGGEVGVANVDNEEGGFGAEWDTALGGCEARGGVIT